MEKLLATGKTDLLDKFVSMRTRRAFKAHLAWDAEAGKVNFEFAPSKFPPRKTFASKTAAAGAGATSAAAKKSAKTPAKKAAAKKTAAPKAEKAARKPAAGKAPSAELAAVIGSEPVARPEAVKKMWEYIKAHNLQDPKDKRTIVADDKLKPVFGGEDSVGMFKLAGIVGGHLG